MDLHFTSRGTRCSATLLLPHCGGKRPPLVVMGHGFGADKSAGLPRFAERFTGAGYAVLMFDYRGWGASDGSPRFLVDQRRHVEDWRAAVDFARGLPMIDSTRMVLWGVSLAGGHVLEIAAERPAGVVAVIAQSPHVSGRAAAGEIPFWMLLRGSLAGLIDVVGSMLGRPHYAKIVGRPGELAAMSSDESYDGFMNLLPPGAKFENKVLARAFLTIPWHDPIRHAERINIPSLIISGTRDSLTPARAVESAAKRIGGRELRMLDCNHYEPHVGAMFEAFVGIEVEFLARAVPVARAMNAPPCASIGAVA